MSLLHFPFFRTVGKANLWIPQSWLLEGTFSIVDTWVPVTDVFGANAGCIHVEFIGTAPALSITQVPQAVSITIEKATLLMLPAQILGEVLLSGLRCL